jgi:hypothetical protein
MKRYEVYIEDIYNKEKSKKMIIDSFNAFEAHKNGLKYTNALREEITKITTNSVTVYNFKSGFNEE